MKKKVTFQVLETLRAKFNKKAKKEGVTATKLLTDFMKSYVKK